jgi:hypothetical protein
MPVIFGKALVIMYLKEIYTKVGSCQIKSHFCMNNVPSFRGADCVSGGCKSYKETVGKYMSNAKA